jgi:hypothetical protein
LRSVQSLNTTLFINTKHNRILRWIKVQANNVNDLAT